MGDDMRNSVGSLIFASAMASVSTQVLAETRIVTTTPQFTWASSGKESKTDGTPLVVDNLQAGDIIDVQIGVGVPHGLITIKQLADVNDNQTTEPVLACGEDRTKKPNAVLRETECGGKSNFGQNFTGSMKLEVLSTFTNDVNFWCTEHFFMMTGTLRLKPKT